MYPMIELSGLLAEDRCERHNSRKEAKPRLPRVEVVLLKYGRKCLHEREDERVAKAAEQ